MWFWIIMTRLAFLAALLCFVAAPLMAQRSGSSQADLLRHPAWNIGVFIGGSTSVASNPSGQSLSVGLRLGRVMTRELGHGFIRGTFEVAADVIPAEEFWINGAQYAGGFDPLILKWNFTEPRRVVPYFAVVGGALFSSSNLPPGDTARANFTSGAEFGAQWLCHSHGTINFAVKPYHLSNASIGNHNPGLNANLQFSLGYTWH